MKSKIISIGKVFTLSNFQRSKIARQNNNKKYNESLETVSRNLGIIIDKVGGTKSLGQNINEIVKCYLYCIFFN